VRKHPFEAPFEAPFVPQGKQGKRGKQGGEGERAGDVGERRGRLKEEIRARVG
jgi:hypothetical protein